MITKLILENWRSHEHSEFEFGKGTNVLIGQMGAGKSSVMDSLCFALFGTFPALQAKKIKLDDIIMNKPVQKDYAKVIVFFSLNGKEYKLLRRIELGKGTTTSEIWEGSKLIEGPQNQRTTEAVCSILKINYDLFSRAVYAEQNNIEYFLEIPKGQRKQKIDELLKISKFEKAKKNLAVLIKRLQDRADEKSKSLERTVEINELPSLLEDIRERHEKLKKEKEEIQAIKTEEAILKEKYESIEKAKGKYERIKKELTELSVKKSMLEEKIRTGKKTARTKEELEEEISRLREALKEAIEKQEIKKNLEKGISSLEMLIKKYEEEKEKIRKRIKELSVIEGLQGLLEKNEKQLEEISKEIQEIKITVKSLQTKKEEEAESENEILKHEKCPVCYSDLTKDKKDEIIKTKEEVIKKIDKKISEKIEVMKKLEEEKKRVTEKIDKIKEEEKKAEEARWMKKREKELEEELEKSRVMLEEKKRENKKLAITDNAEEIREKIESAKKELEYAQSLYELENAEKRINELLKEKERTIYDEKVEKEIFEKLKEKEKQHALLHQRISNSSQLLEEKEKRAEELTRLKNEIEKNKKAVEKLKEINSSLLVLSNVLDKLQTELRQEFTDTTNAALTDIWKKLYPYGDYPDLRLAIDEKGDYLLQVKTVTKRWVNVEGIASGGERSTAALALRIAFSLVLTQNLSWLVLDEPTHNLDKEAIRELALMLKEHLPLIVEQVFIITHEPLLEEAASSFLYRLERNKAEEMPTRVIPEQLY